MKFLVLNVQLRDGCPFKHKQLMSPEPEGKC